MNLTGFFISAPLSAVYTLLLSLSMYLVFDEAGKAVFKYREVWARAMYFFSGLLILSWAILVLCLTGVAQSSVFKAIFWSFLLIASMILIRKSREGFLAETIEAFRSHKASVLSRFYLYAAFFVFILFLLLALSPPTDADSLDYHLGVPVQILEKGFWGINKDQLHFRMAGFGEMLNLLGIANGCVQMGSFIQMLAFSWMLRVFTSEETFDNRISIMILCLGIPSLLLLIPSQKHLLTGTAGTAIVFYVISQKSQYLNGKLLMLMACCLCFAIGIKYSFILSAAVIVLFYLWKNFYRTGYSMGIFAGVFLIFLGPLFLYRVLQFGDPLSPLLEKFKSQPNPIILHFHDFLKQYKDSSLDFPLTLLIPSSPGEISTILGWGIVIIVSFLLSYRNYKREVFILLFYIVLLIAFGQKTSRFFLEPYLWIVPLIVKEVSVLRFGKYIVSGAKAQFLVMIPVIVFACFTLCQGVFSDRLREQVLSKSASFYDEAKWVNGILPADAVICTDIRSRALLSNSFFPIEFLYFSSLKNVKEASMLDSMLKQYKVDYIILSDDALFDEFRSKYAGKIIAGPRQFYQATRNPFNRREYRATLYKMRY